LSQNITPQNTNAKAMNSNIKAAGDFIFAITLLEKKLDCWQSKTGKT